jgi:hypothetical protein
VLSPEPHQVHIDPGLLGFGAPLTSCPNCRNLNERYNYGLSVVLKDSWNLQNSLFGGYGAITGSLSAQKIAVVTTFGEGSFDDAGTYRYSSHVAFYAAIDASLAPDDPPPPPIG